MAAICGSCWLIHFFNLRIVKLCSTWDYALSHGLKSSVSSLFKNVTDIVIGGNTEQTSTFWDFAYSNLSRQERERFSTLRHVWTDGGKVRALIRALLNERSFERYILVWLNDPNLANSFEEWAFLRDSEVQNLLPSIAAGKLNQSNSFTYSVIFTVICRSRLDTFRYIRRQSRAKCIVSLKRNSPRTSYRGTHSQKQYS